MDAFIERLRGLAQNKVFAYSAVIFFAFLIALIFALFALQPSLMQSPDDIRTSVLDTNQAPSQGTSGTGGTFGGASGTQTGAQTGGGAGGTGSSTGQPAGTDGTGGTGGTAVGTTAPVQTRKPTLMERIIAVFTGKSISQVQQNTQPTTSQGSAQDPATIKRKRVEDMQRVMKGSLPPPAIGIDNFVLTTDIPEAPAALTMYQLQNSFSDIDVSELAGKLGFDGIDAVEKGETLSQLYDLKNQHYLGFDRSTGAFTYSSSTGFTPSQNSSTPLQTAKTVLADIGFDDTTIQPTATYKRTDDPNYIYVELHRDWGAIGAPIINPLGIMNLLESQKLDSISFASQPDSRIPSAFITDTSDNTDGVARPDSFNTATVKLSLTDGKVYGVSTNIPRITSSETLSQDTIKSPIQAYNELKSGQASFALTGPSGHGSLNLADVYSNNRAQAETVDVTDFELVYPASQASVPSFWCPAYTFRSFGTVQTGFDVQFAHTVPASSDPRCQSQVLGESTSTKLAQNTNTGTPATGAVIPTTIVGTNDASSLQYGTLTFQTVTIVDTPTSDCPTNFNHSYLVKITNSTTQHIAWTDFNEPQPPGRMQNGRGIRGFKPRDWYFVEVLKAGAQPALSSLNSSYTLGQLMSFRAAAILNSKIGNPNLSPLDPRLQNLQIVSCQHIVTGSPWIHAYADTPTDLSISIDPVGGVAYVNPRFSYTDQATWNVKTGTDGQLTFTDGLTKDGIFWEYYRNEVRAAYAAFIKQHPQKDEGFVVATAQLPAFMKGLTARLGLTATEQKHVVAELERDSMQMQSPFVRVRFAPEQFLNDSLPMNIQPRPDSLNRLYFELSPLETYEKMPQPELPTIIRDGLTIVETGFIVTK